MKITNSPKTKKQPKQENLTTVVKLSKDLGCTRATVYNWIKAGKIIEVEHLEKTWVDKSWHPLINKKETTNQA